MGGYGVEPDAIIEFWWNAGPEKWFSKDEAFDETIRKRFLDVYERAAEGALDGWMEEPRGALALVILLDQFPRNMFRGTPRAFATDEKAKTIGVKALERGDHETVAEDINQFLAIPLMHSEDLADQDACVEWMEVVGSEENRKFARHHRDIIARFGRFPHRNAVLGRETTPEEAAFLEEDGFRG
ncbi:DUF924 domain-containing protein [Fulvimarina endophytica]|uniref:DUF924 domain-containing protein n=1 Tax=Fulvimarina endophytica TaxID=2293836 RepID=A0A371X0E4_9HYPH|nr:DUF924 family protein [Fulvimarina endophytica]RFC62676.1 DUF924 domain-containing protein [Fulvimarina endophytica]